LRELHGFQKVFLQAGEESEVHMMVDKYATSLWDEVESMWKSEEGTYEVLVGFSSQEILATGELIVPETRFWLGL
jgi:beta-glucosidase